MKGIGYRYAIGATAFLALVPVHALAASACPYVWDKNISIGATGSAVLKLQQLLNQDPSTTVAASGIGSAGSESDVFGGLTKKAVIAFQNKFAADILVPNGLASGNGFVGAATRAKLNALCVAGIQPQAPISMAASAAAAASGLTISVPQQPDSMLAPAGALYVPFTDITLTAGGQDVTVNSITVERVGPASDQTFIDIDLFDDQGSYLGIAYFTSDHKAIFRNPLVVPAGTSVTLSVVGDMALDLTAHDGEMAGLQVVAIDASAPVGGSLPVRGTLQTMNSSLVIGSAMVSLAPEDPFASRTRFINDTGITFSAIRVTAGSIEDVKLTYLAWRQNGTASPSDLKNVQIIVDGVAYPAEIDDRSYFVSLGDGIVIPKGRNVTLEIRGDLTITGAYRTVQFDIYDGGDIGLEGMMYGYGIFPVPEANTGSMGDHSAFITEDGTPDTDSLRPYFAGSPVTISSGAEVFIGR